MTLFQIEVFEIFAMRGMQALGPLYISIREYYM